MKKYLAYFIFILFFLPAHAANQENEKVVLQLKWFHQFQFAGYYAAKEKGFYNDVGLDVDIREKDLALNNIDQVISGEAQYGVADSVLILYKAKDASVVIVSPIFQHSPSVLISLKKSGINSPYELADKTITFYENDNDGFSILAMLNKLGIKPNLIRKREKDDYLKLINEEVDLSPVYLSNELFHFKEQNIDVNIINPMNYGVDLYGDMLFTNQHEAQEHPERVKKFKEATLKGWEYALNNKEELIQLIHQQYASNKSLEHLHFEAKAIEQIIAKDIIPLGTIDKGRMQYIYDLYSEYGLPLQKINLNNFIFDDYLTTTFESELTDDEKAFLEGHPTLKVQNMSSFPPYNFNQQGVPMGYTVDFIKLLAQKIGMEVEFIGGKSWKESLEMLAKNELDVMPNIVINKDRQAYIDFTAFKHFDYSISVAVRKDLMVTSMADLQGKVVTVLNKSFLHDFLAKNFPEQKLYLASDVMDAVESVANGQADAAIGNASTIDYYISQNWLSNVKNLTINNLLGQSNKVGVYLGVSKGNLRLKSILEKANASLSHNEVLKLKQKWLDINETPKVRFTEQELGYLQTKQALTMCIDPNWLPFEKIENTQHIGMTSEYIKLFQQDLPIPIKLINTRNWLETLKFSKERKCDFVSIMTPSEERKKYFNFTRALMEMPIVIATQYDKPFINDISNVASKKLGIVEGFAYAETLKKEYPAIKLVEVKGTQDGLSRVQQGELYGLIGVLPAVGYNISENYIGDLKIAGKVDDALAFPMATRVDEPLLNSVLNKLIAEVSEQENKDILNKWLSIKYEEQVNYSNVIILSLLLIGIIVLILYKNRSISNINEKLESHIKIVDENVLMSSTDLDGKITYVSDAFCKMTGYTQEELIGKSHNIVKHEDMDERIYESLWKRVTKGKVWKGELKNKNKEGEGYWIEATISPIYDHHHSIIGYSSIRHDITDKKLIEAISITDGLTNIYNRRHFNAVFPKYLNSLKRDKGLFSFLLMDVDYFKQYNDIYGHQKGDDVLQQIASALTGKMHRADDFCFRLGGEEFGLLFKSRHRENILTFVESIRESIEALHIEHTGSEISQYVTVSIGLYSVCADEHHHVDDIFKDADDLLYKAKRNGRNQTMFNVTS